MKIVFGLGNVGKEYINTRHNVGFQLIDYLKKKSGINDSSIKMNGECCQIRLDNEVVMLVKPLKYMNLSGEVVRNYVSFYKVSLDDILVIHDDIDMSLGKIRFVYDSTSGGHNGIKNIENCLGTKQYFRLKIGVSKSQSVNIRDYVTGHFSSAEIKVIDSVNNYLADLLIDFVHLNKQEIMNKYNNKIGCGL